MKNKQTRTRAKRRLFLRRTKRITKASALTAWRLVLFTLMLLLLLMCVAWVVFVRAFNAQNLSERIAYQLQRQLNRPVKVGSIHLKFLNEIELKDFSILDTVGEPGKPLVSANSVTLSYDILPLFERKVVIREVTLNAPRFNLVRTKTGVYNVADIKLSRAKKAEPQGAVQEGDKYEVSIEDWGIKNGVISFKDLETDEAHSIYGLNASFDHLRFNELSHFEMGMILRNQWQERISEMEIEASGQINFADFNWKDFSLRDVKTQVFMFQQPVDITLDLDDVTAPVFTLTASAPAFEGKDVSIFGEKIGAFAVPASTLIVQGNITDEYQRLKITQLNAKADDVELSASGVADFSKEPFTMQADFSTNFFTLPGKERYWKPLQKYGLAGKGSASGSIARAQGVFSLPLLVLQAQQVAGDFYGFKVTGASGTFQAKNNFSDLYARTTSGKVQIARSTFDKLQLSGSWRKGNLYAYIASSQLNEEPLKMNVTVNNLKSDARRINTHLYFKNFDPMAFIETVKDFVTVITPLTKHTEGKLEVTGELAWLRNFRDRLPDFMPSFSGTLSADAFSSTVLTAHNFQAEFDFTGMQAGAKKLSGPLDIRVQDGVIHQMEKLAAEQEALNVTFQPFIMMHRMERAGSFSVGRVLTDVKVTELGASVLFNNGAMKINNAYSVGPTMSASVSGDTDWVKELFDLTIYTMFTNTSKSGVLAENLTDESGNPALAFRVSSSMTKPKLEMLRAKKAGKTIRTAQEKGVNTDFSKATKFIQGEHHATK